nr:hypothetical protein [Edaphobacter sp. 12200R-103]
MRKFDTNDSFCKWSRNVITFGLEVLQADVADSAFRSKGRTLRCREDVSTVQQGTGRLECADPDEHGVESIKEFDSIASIGFAHQYALSLGG